MEDKAQVLSDEKLYRAVEAAELLRAALVRKPWREP